MTPSFSVVAEGDSSEKCIKGLRDSCVVRPFVGLQKQKVRMRADSETEVLVTYFGIGFDFQLPTFGQSRFLGFPGVPLLLRSLRALKLLELAPFVTLQGALCAAWYAAAESIAKDREQYLDLFGELFLTYEESQKARAQAIAFVPREEELRMLIEALEAEDAGFSRTEILSALEHRDSEECVLERISSADALRRQNIPQECAPAASYSFPEHIAFST